MTALLNTTERVAIARLHALLELLPAALDKRLGPAGITAFEYTLLDSLADAEDQRMRMSALASKTNASLPRVSRVVTSLEKRGLVYRAACEADGRATNAALTPEGARTYHRSSQLYADAVRDLVLEGLNELPNGNGVTHLSDLSYAILTSLDTARAKSAGPSTCAADPRSATTGQRAA